MGSIKDWLLGKTYHAWYLTPPTLIGEQWRCRKCGAVSFAPVKAKCN